MEKDKNIDCRDMDKDNQINTLLAIAGKENNCQRIREVVRVNGVDMFEPCDDPNVITLVLNYDDEKSVPENRKLKI